jgi:diguanylate cyclase (GGDEF)-like protein
MQSFRLRLLVLTISLIAVTQTVTLSAVLANSRQTVQARSAEQLRADVALAEQQMLFRGAQLASGVAVLASDFGFREAVAGGDAPTILSAADNGARRVGADLAVVFDTSGTVLASTVSDVAMPASEQSFSDLVADPDSGHHEAHFRVFGNHAYQVLVAPVRTPATIAWVLMGFVIDRPLVQSMHELVDAQVELVAHAANGAVLSVSTLGARDAPPDRRGEHTVEIAGTQYISFARRLDADGDPIDIVLLKPIDEVFAPYRELRNAMLVIDGVALVLAGFVSVILGRSATRPIGALVLAAERIEKGHYQTEVPIAGGEEFRALASSFNLMQRHIAAREADIIYQAEHDPLTSLPNRRVAVRELQALTASAEGSECAALIMIELRNLSEILASVGYQVGDEVLLEAVRRLQQNIGVTDVLARITQTQFLLITRHCTVERALLYAEQLIAAVNTGLHISNASFDLRMVCGISLYPLHGQDADDLLQRSQVAVAEADEARTRVALYRMGQEDENRRRLILITDLRVAIDQDALELFYQPKVTMSSRTVKSMEALLRWTHPRLGVVSPGEFVPLAERTGGSRALTHWVLAAGIRQLGTWRRGGLELDLAINLSAPDLLDSDLSEIVLALLRQHQVEPSALILEITESAIMREPRTAARNIQLLRIAGVRFSMDDFGTGYSSLSQLSVLPLDELKIDRSFIQQSGSPSAVTIVTSTIELGHSLGLKVVAEGVESSESWNLLRRLGCDYAQGYLVSPPMPASEVEKFVNEANRLLPASDSTMQQLRTLEHLSNRGLR